MCKQKRKTRLQVPRPNGNQPLVQLGNSVYYIVMGEKKVYARNANAVFLIEYRSQLEVFTC